MSAQPRQAVILAGGLGTRLRPLTNDLPKPMLPFHGRPFLEYLIVMLRDAGIRRVLLLVGYRAEKIVDHFGDGSAFGIPIDYSHSAVEDETGTRLRRARAKIDPLFLLLYCDNYVPLDLDRLTTEYWRQQRRALTTVYENADGWTKDNVRVASDGGIVAYDRSRTAADLRGVDIGFGLFESSVLDLLPSDTNVSFEATVYPQLIAAGELGAMQTQHRYYSVGSLERLAETDEFLARRKTVLLDRDGTLNRRMPPGEYVNAWDDFVWLPGALDGLRALHCAGYRTAVITNQPGLARGMASCTELNNIHHRMVAEARAAGGAIDAFYVCPHGWDDGCACRKPRPGLLLQAQREMRLDLSRTTFIGDDDRDGMAARAAGAKFIHVGSGEATILDAVSTIITGERQFVSVS